MSERGSRKSSRPGRSRGGLRKSANLDSVLVEEPFALAKSVPSATNHPSPTNSDDDNAGFVGGGSSRDARKKGSRRSDREVIEDDENDDDNGTRIEFTGQGCYVRAMANNKRYYGVLVDQASLQEASDLWFRDYAQSLNLNRRMKVLFDFQHHKQLRLEHQKQEQAQQVAASTGASAAAQVETTQNDKDGTDGGSDSDGNDTADGGTVRKKRSLDAATASEALPVAPVSTTAQAMDKSATASTPSASTAAATARAAAVQPPRTPNAANQASTATPASIAKETPQRKRQRTSPPAPEPPQQPQLGEEDFPNRPIQKLKYFPSTKAPPKRAGTTRPSSSSAQNQVVDTGYRVLIATYCNMYQAAEGDPDFAQRIWKACDDGGNFVVGANDASPATATPYYYQYEVLPTALSVTSKKDQELKFGQEDGRQPRRDGQGKGNDTGLHMSMGMHEFLQNTPLPPWFPLSNHQTGSKSKILDLLSMKQDSQGNVVWDVNTPDLDHMIAQGDGAVAAAATSASSLSSSRQPSAAVGDDIMTTDAPTPPNERSRRGRLAQSLRSSSSPSPSPKPTPSRSPPRVAATTSAAALLAGTYVPMKPRASKRYQIGVLGGGIAGLSCCLELIRQLEEQNIDAQVVLLEGRDRLGGRLHTDRTTFKPQNPNGRSLETRQSAAATFPVDLGASWIHGIDHNPLAVLAKKAGLDFATASEEVVMLSSGCQTVDHSKDESMKKLFDDLLDLAADASWAKPEFADSTFGSKTNRKHQTTVKFVQEQAAVRWYASKLVPSTPSAAAEAAATEAATTTTQEAGKAATATTTPREGVRTSTRIKEKERSRLTIPEGIVETTSTPPHRRSSDRSIDFEIGNAIAKHKQREFSKIGETEHRMLLWNTKNIEYALGANIVDLSMRHWDSDERHAFEGDHVLLPQGYSSVVEHIRKELEKTGPDRFQCHLNYPIGRVEYARKSSTEPHSERDRMSGRIRRLVELSDTCSVSRQDGTQTMYFDFLVSALPLGVLKDSVAKAYDVHTTEKVTFSPNLPFPKRDAIQNVGFGLLNKVYVQFAKPFWRELDVLGDDPVKSVFGNSTGVNPHQYMFFDMGKILGTKDSRPAILMTLISGKEAVACERLTDADMVAQVMSTLREIFSKMEVPEPIAHRITRWGHDKFSRGCYTYLPPGATDQDFHLLKSPINAENDPLTSERSGTMRLFFAGEHTSVLHPSMAHGAMISGLRAAKEIVSAMKSGQREDASLDKNIPMVVYRYENRHEQLTCRLCHKEGSQIREGALLAFQRGARQTLAHSNCAEYSPEVEVIDGKWKNVLRAVTRGRQLECYICGVTGATIGCTAEGCYRIHHFGCAEDTGWRFDRDGKVFLCDLHRQTTNDEVSKGACDRVSMPFFLAHNPASEMICGFCKAPEGTDRDHGLGQLLAFSLSSARQQQVCAHNLCAKYTNIVETKPLESSRMGMEYQNIFAAIRQAKRCNECRKTGATVKCMEDDCYLFYHISCAMESGWKFGRNGKRHFRCITHRFSKSKTHHQKSSGGSGSSSGSPKNRNALATARSASSSPKAKAEAPSTPPRDASATPNGSGSGKTTPTRMATRSSPAYSTRSASRSPQPKSGSEPAPVAAAAAATPSPFKHNLFARFGATVINGNGSNGDGGGGGNDDAEGGGPDTAQDDAATADFVTSTARPNIRFESKAANDDIGGAKESDYESSEDEDGVIDLVSDSDESYHGHDGSGLQVLDLPLASDIPGSKLMVRLERPSREDLWNLTLQVIQDRRRKTASSRLLVASVGPVRESDDKEETSGGVTASSSVQAGAVPDASTVSSTEARPMTMDPMKLQVGDTVVSLNGSRVGSDELKTLRMVLFRLKQEIDIMVEVVRDPNWSNRTSR